MRTGLQPDMSLRRSARLSTASSTAAETGSSAASKPKRGRTTASTTAASAKKRKNTAAAAEDAARDSSAPASPSGEDGACAAAPRMPVSKRHKATVQAFTPAGVRLLARTARGSPKAEHQDARGPRPAEPHATNAPLSTPGGSLVVSYAPPGTAPASPAPSPSKRKKKEAAALPPDIGAARPPPTATTDTLLRDACAHLCRVDAGLQALIDKHHCEMFSPQGLREVVDPFTALASGIIGQQVGGSLFLQTIHGCVLPSH